MNRLLMEALSLESAEQPKAPEFSQEELLTAQLSVESAALDIQESAHTLEMIGYQLSELDHAHATLESMSVSLESLLEKDERGLDRVAAEGYAIAARAVLGDAMPQPVASLESFGGATESAHATQITLEGLVEGAKKLWETIKRVVVNAIRAVRDYFAKIFTGVDGLNKNINALTAKVNAAESGKLVVTAEGGKFKVARGSDISWNGKVDGASVLAGMKAVDDNVVKPVSGMTDASETLYKDVISAFKGGKLESVQEAIKAAKKAGETLGATDETATALPGAYELKTKIEVGAEGYMVSASVDIKRSSDQVKDVEVDVYSLADIKKMLAGVATMVGAINKKQKTIDAIVKMRQDLTKEVDKWAADLEAGRIKTEITKAQAGHVMRSAQSDLVSSVAKMTNFLFSYVRAILTAANSALGAYGEKKAEGSSESSDGADEASTEADDAKKKGEDGEGDEEGKKDDDAGEEGGDEEEKEKKDDE